MDFNDRLQRIGADQAAEDQMKRAVDALRSPASRKIEDLLTTTVKYLTHQGLPTLDLIGTGLKKEVWEHKRLFRAPEKYVTRYIVHITAARGWKLAGTVVQDVTGPLFLTTKAEIFRGVPQGVLDKATGRYDSWLNNELPQPTKLPANADGVMPMYDDYLNACLEKDGRYVGHFLTLAHRDGFAVSRSGRPALVSFNPKGGEWYNQPEWEVVWLDDRLESAVKHLIQMTKR